MFQIWNGEGFRKNTNKKECVLVLLLGMCVTILVHPGQVLWPRSYPVIWEGGRLCPFVLSFCEGSTNGSREAPCETLASKTSHYFTFWGLVKTTPNSFIIWKRSQGPDCSFLCWVGCLGLDVVGSCPHPPEAVPRMLCTWRFDLWTLPCFRPGSRPDMSRCETGAQSSFTHMMYYPSSRSQIYSKIAPLVEKWSCKRLHGVPRESVNRLTWRTSFLWRYAPPLWQRQELQNKLLVHTSSKQFDILLLFPLIPLLYTPSDKTRIK